MDRKPELVLVGIALAGGIASCAWFGFFAERDLERNSARMLTGGDAMKPQIALEVHRETAPKLVNAVWSPPRAQARSSRWIYDVFTPPQIFYDAGLEKFTVTPPVTGLEKEDANETSIAEPAFALRLVSVARIPFRLQLIGFVKTENGHLGLFENKITTEIFLAGKGKLLPELGLTIEEMEVHSLEARASIRDSATGETTTLSNRERQYCPAPRATVETDVANGTRQDVGAGDEIVIDGVVYQIEAIQLSPAAVDITRRVPGSNSIDERRTLTLSEPEPEAGRLDAAST